MSIKISPSESVLLNFTYDFLWIFLKQEKKKKKKKKKIINWVFILILRTRLCAIFMLSRLISLSLCILSTQSNGQLNKNIRTSNIWQLVWWQFNKWIISKPVVTHIKIQRFVSVYSYTGNQSHIIDFFCVESNVDRMKECFYEI